MVKIAFTVGRFQPPTIGHKALIQAVKDAAGPGGKAYVFVSSTQGSGKEALQNPLTSAQKMPILNHLVPTGVEFIDTAACKARGELCGGAFHAFRWLLDKKGYDPKDITLVVGDDHRRDFGPDADMWKRKKEADVLAPGHFVFLASEKRDNNLDVKDAANMSGTKAREYVKKDRKGDFYIAVGYDKDADKEPADAVYEIIKASQSSSKTAGGTRGDTDEEVYGADVEFEYLTGGRRIAQGGSSAVFTVPFPCDAPSAPADRVMLISLNRLRAVFETKGASELQPMEDDGPLPGVLTKLREIDPEFNYFYYPIACTPRAPKEGEPIDPDISELTMEQRERLAPFVQIVPYAKRGTLRDNPPTKQQLAYLKKAVKLLHSNGIAHFDLTDANVVLADDNLPRIIDFGQSILRDGDDGVIPPAKFKDEVTSWAEAVESDRDNLRFFGSKYGSGRRRTYRRRTTRSKASGRALSRRGSRSRTGSSRTIRSSCGSRGCSKGSNTW